MGAGQPGVQGQPGLHRTCLKTQKRKQQKEVISDLGVVTHTCNFNTWVIGRTIAIILRPSCPTGHSNSRLARAPQRDLSQIE